MTNEFNLEQLDADYLKHKQETIDWLNTRKYFITGSVVNSLRVKPRIKPRVMGYVLHPAELDHIIKELTIFDESDTIPASKAIAHGHEVEATIAKQELEPKGYHHWDNIIIAGPNKPNGVSPDFLNVPMTNEFCATDKRVLHHSLVPATKGVEVKAFGADKHLKIAITEQVPEDIKDQIAWYFACIPTLEYMELCMFNAKVAPEYQRVTFGFSIKTNRDMQDRVAQLKGLAKISAENIQVIKSLLNEEKKGK